MSGPTRTAWRWLMAVGLVLSLAACHGANGKGHVEASNAAAMRWKAMRSGLLLQMARQQFGTGDLDEAQRSLNEGLGVDPENARLHVLYGRIHIERGQLERAAEYLDHAIVLEPRLAEAHYYKGLVQQRWQRYEGALENYQQAFVIEGDNVFFLLAVSEMLVALDRVEEAQDLLQEKMVYFDQNAGIRLALGQLCTMRQDHVQAVNYFRQAHMLRPDDLRTSEELALSLVRAGQLEEAIGILRMLCAEPTLASRRDLPRTLAAAYESAGRQADARDMYVKMTQSDPNDVETWIRLGQRVWAMEDSEGALLAASKVMALAPARADGYLLAGMVWEKRGRLDEALRLYDRAAAAAPNNPDPVLLRGIALERAGQSAAAAEAYAEALRRSPDDLKAKGLLARFSSVSENNIAP